MNLTIEKHIMTLSEIHARIGFHQIYMESIVKCDQRKIEHYIKVCYVDPQTCSSQNVQSRLVSSHVPNVLAHIEAMVQMSDDGMGSNMY